MYNHNPPRYPKNQKETNLYKTLRKDVLSRIGMSSPLKKIHYIFSAILLGIFLGSTFALLFLGDYPILYLAVSALLGIVCLPIFLNIGHEAIHLAFSPSRKINYIAKHVFLLLGTSDYFWKLRHLSSHHALSNVKDWDADISQTKAIRLSPKQTFKRHHKLQHIYMPFLFLFYTFVWFVYRDFMDLANHNFGIKHVDKHPRKEIFMLFAAKFWHLGSLIVVPIIMGAPVWLSLTGYAVFHLFASIVTTFALVSTHVGKEQEIVCMDSNGYLPYSWLEHQFRTTADFDTRSKWMSWFFGGFNHHLAHHLFPDLSHVYYPQITPILKTFAKQNSLPYYDYKTLPLAITAHLKRLKLLSLNNEL